MTVTKWRATRGRGALAALGTRGTSIAPTRLRFPEKCARLGDRLRDAEWRRYGATLLLGKLIGVALLLAAIFIVPKLPDLLFGGSTAFAQQSATAPATAPAAAAAPDPYSTAKAGDIINPLNTVWTLVAAFLVFGMQVGFTMLEAGFCRSRETVNVLVECVFDTCLCGILYYAWGYAFMFGAGNGFIGWHDPNDPNKSWFFLQNVTATTTYGAYGVPVLAHWIFQFAFADCAPAIFS